MFGVSIDAFGGISDVLFGTDLDNDGAYRSATAQYTDADRTGGISADNPRYTRGYINSGFSVQLVKPVDIAEPTAPYLISILVLWITFLVRRGNLLP